MKKYFMIFIGVLIVSLGSCLWEQHIRIQNLNDKLYVAVNNNKAYEAQVDSLENNTIQFQYAVDQLNHSNDSLVQKLNQTRKQLKVKDNKIAELQYIASENKKVDSVFVRDTIFRNPEFVLDTAITDKWSSLKLHAEYPNLIAADYSFNNETTVIMQNSRVTIDPPKKFFVWRWFQKKHTIVEVDVVQENPYCVNKEERFVKVIR